MSNGGNMSNTNCIGLRTVNWKDGWKPQVKRFLKLKSESKLIRRNLINKKYLFMSYFENGENVVLPQDIAESCISIEY